MKRLMLIFLIAFTVFFSSNCFICSNASAEWTFCCSRGGDTTYVWTPTVFYSRDNAIEAKVAFGISETKVGKPMTFLFQKNKGKWTYTRSDNGAYNWRSVNGDRWANDVLYVILNSEIYEG